MIANGNLTKEQDAVHEYDNKSLRKPRLKRELEISRMKRVHNIKMVLKERGFSTVSWI
jgi:hypothetical protein